jgi:hypothetical protein
MEISRHEKKLTGLLNYLLLFLVCLLVLSIIY